MMSTTQRICGAVILAELAGCGTSHDPTYDPHSQLKQQALASAATSEIGKRYWIRRITTVCPSPDPNPSPLRCPFLDEGGFTIENAKLGEGYRAWVGVRFDTGARGYIEYNDLTKYAWADRPGLSLPELKRSIAQMKAESCTGGPRVLRVGMSTDDALRAWCFPDRTNTTKTRDGTHEQWVYDKRGYLYFDNDKLTAIQYTN
jgi:hypothetical protein